MGYIQCTKCLTKMKNDDGSCLICESVKLVRYKNGKFFYQGQAFSLGRWYSCLSMFNEANDSLKLKQSSLDIEPTYIKLIYQKNIKRFTFLGIILPIVLFIVCSAVSLIVGHILFQSIYFYNTRIFLFFLSALFFLFSLILFIQYYFLGLRCYYQRNECFQYQYTKISKKNIQQKLLILDKYIINN